MMLPSDKTYDDIATCECQCDMDSIWVYGSNAQSKITDFSKSLSKTLATNTVAESERNIENAIVSLEEMTSQKRLLGNTIFISEKRYRETINSIDNLSVALRLRQAQLLKEIKIYERLERLIREGYEELEAYIRVGEARLSEVRSVEFSEANEESNNNNLIIDIDGWKQRFERKLSELKTSQIIATQGIVQIGLMMNNNAELSEKIGVALSTTIPLWRNHIALALGLEIYDKDNQNQRKVIEVANKNLKAENKSLKKKVNKLRKRDKVDIVSIKRINGGLRDTIEELERVERKMGDSEADMINIINGSINKEA